jgi:hypothetical protein
MKTSALALLMLCNLAIADGVNYATPARGETPGQYVYGTPPTDSRMPQSGFMIGKPDREDFDFFTADEEVALWDVLQTKLALRNEAQMIEARNANAKSRATSYGQLKWPRIVVDGKTICAPELSHSEDQDWREFLLCWSEQK